MSGGPLKPKFLFAASLSCLMLAGLCFGKRRRAGSQPAAQEQAADQAVQTPPPTLAQQPASPPQVSFQGGELTITAQNSTLGDILKAVRAQTGATIDLPGTAPERVVGHFGPAPARDVLASLLNGSHFNYLLLGSPTDPSALDRVILIAKSGASAESSPPLAVQQQANNYPQSALPRPMAPMAAPGGNTVTVEGQDADSTDDATDDSAESTDDATDDSTDQTDQADDQAATDDQQQQQQDGQQSVKTPEQLLQELQQRQQQLQQQGAQPGVPPGMRQFPNPGQQVGPGGQSGQGGPDTPAPLPPH
jgi:hypothetical protein